jgi:hypothetical protein
MSGLTNQYVENLGKLICGRNFLGTFPCDILPNVAKKQQFSLVINLSKHDSKGSHFVAIFCNKNVLLYFDPLAEKCTNKFILKFIEQNKKKRKIKKKFRKIQSDDSIFCGYFCLAFLQSNYLQIPNKTFFKHFDKEQLLKNDTFVIDFIQKYI